MLPQSICEDIIAGLPESALIGLARKIELHTPAHSQSLKNGRSYTGPVEEAVYVGPIYILPGAQEYRRRLVRIM